MAGACIPVRTVCLLGLFAAAHLGGPVVQELAAEEAPSRPLLRPASLTRYDLATPDDLFIARMIDPLVAGNDPNDWAILSDIDEHLGGWITQFVTANRIANTINEALPVEGQPALKRIEALVAECADVLHVKKPNVFIRSSPLPRSYIVQVDDEHFLVLTSALLRLYEGQEDELRFVVGHELGHLKCNHLRMKNASYGLLVAIQAINLAVVPDEAQVLLPALGFGRLLSWMRESEISADRAGLLCCQDPQVAYNALARLLSGLEAGSTWIDPASPDFNAEALVKEYQKWENEPFVSFVQHVRRFSSESPFIPERVAALKLWADSEAWKKILARTKAESSDLLVIVDAISVSGLAPKDETVDAYIVAYDGHEKVFTSSVVGDCHGATWKDINVARRYNYGKPLFFEIWDSNYGSDVLVAGFTVFLGPPKRNEAKVVYHQSLVRNWKERTNAIVQGRVQVRVYFKERAK